jgi:hypothetical protein
VHTPAAAPGKTERACAVCVGADANPIGIGPRYLVLGFLAEEISEIARFVSPRLH